MSTITFEDPDDLARGGAKYLAEQITASPGPRVSVGLAGGSTPAAVYRELRHHEIDWERVDFWLSDERWVPWDNSDSNGKMAYANLIAAVRSRFLRPRFCALARARRVGGALRGRAAVASSPGPFARPGVVGHG